MNLYLLVKTLHIVSSVLLVGTGFGSAFYLFFTNRAPSLEARAVVARLVVRADLWFTTPAVIVQPLSGLWLAHTAGWPLSTPWLLASVLLYAVAGACWLPVLWLQLKMAREVEAALASGRALSAHYARWQRAWESLGYPAFVAMLAVFFLMVNKPALWA
ncbi:DUF2269 family protein [Roseateles sp. NT4]|uniref:DUF2269 family protein n=1 Tax=Roseateles sp. NT4 TaxID=3453715 RepID=UPI003EE837A7